MYLDDATLGGPVDKIIHDLGAIIPALSMIGLEMKASKFEVVNLNLDAVDFQKALEKIQSILKEVQVTALEKLVMLGAPIFSSAVKDSLSAKHSQLLKMIDRLSYVSAHQAFFLLKNCLAIPKLLFILRCFPSYREHALLKKYEQTLRDEAAKIRNINFDDTGWLQTKLPVRHGGIGLRSPSDLALPVYLSSRVACRSLISDVFNNTNGHRSEVEFVAATKAWVEKDLQLPSNPEFKRN